MAWSQSRTQPLLNNISGFNSVSPTEINKRGGMNPLPLLQYSLVNARFSSMHPIVKRLVDCSDLVCHYTQGFRCVSTNRSAIYPLTLVPRSVEASLKMQTYSQTQRTRSQDKPNSVTSLKMCSWNFFLCCNICWDPERKPIGSHVFNIYTIDMGPIERDEGNKNRTIILLFTLESLVFRS